MIKAFGGRKALQGLKEFQYTLRRTTYQADQVIRTETRYTLDLSQNYLTVCEKTSEGDSVLKQIDQSGAWLIQHEHKQALSQQEKEALQRVFFYNFIPMLRNEKLRFTFVNGTTYKGRQAAIVRVSDPENPKLVLDLFMDAENGQILTSSKATEGSQDPYPYFADELEYSSIGKGVIFPLVYQVYVNGKLSSEGKFEDVGLKK
ncbi:hypothetical protein [Pontibacter ummariensis]|nr:hypothetical protein [Pontibacter ummariensis]